mmetsp:Transcript_27753/g.24368  ORF Transcript_27753/g.24368 Transcript_27753/m.24368 type:complete len:89 (-) Transcript_27753:618-884(-)
MSIFKEAEFNFKPTYRRMRDDPGYSNKKGQCPSWTDRVFVKSRPSQYCQILEYDSMEHCYLSDHRPVYQVLEVAVEPPYINRKYMYAD